MRRRRKSFGRRRRGRRRRYYTVSRGGVRIMNCISPINLKNRGLGDLNQIQQSLSLAFLRCPAVNVPLV